MSLKERRNDTYTTKNKGYGPLRAVKQNRLTIIKEKLKKRNMIFSSPYMTPRAQCTPTRQGNYQFSQAGDSSIKLLLIILTAIGKSSKRPKEEQNEA